MTKENDYKTSSGSELQDKFRNTVSIPQNIRGELAKAGDTIRDAEQTAATALALTFSSVGIVKSVIPISSEGGYINGIGNKVKSSLINQKPDIPLQARTRKTILFP